MTTLARDPSRGGVAARPRQDLSGVKEGKLTGRGGKTQTLGAAAQRRLRKPTVSTFPAPAPPKPAWQQLRDLGMQGTGTAAGNRAALANQMNGPNFMEGRDPTGVFMDARMDPATGQFVGRGPDNQFPGDVSTEGMDGAGSYLGPGGLESVIARLNGGSTMGMEPPGGGGAPPAPPEAPGGAPAGAMPPIVQAPPMGRPGARKPLPGVNSNAFAPAGTSPTGKPVTPTAPPAGGQGARLARLRSMFAPQAA